MELKNTVALVTGANRGLGLAFATALLEAGVKKVYAASRHPSEVALPGLHTNMSWTIIIIFFL